MQRQILKDRTCILEGVCDTRFIQLASMISHIKKSLLSRDVVSEVKSIQYMIEIITSYQNQNDRNRVIHFLLVEDIIDLLCEVIATTDIRFIRLVFCFLLLLTKYDAFYMNNEDVSIRVFQCVLRTLNILLKQNVAHSIIKIGLSILSTIIKRTSCRKFFKSASYQKEPLLMLIMHILRSSSMGHFLSVLIPIICCVLREGTSDVSHKLLPSIAVLLQALCVVLNDDKISVCRKEKITIYLSNLCSSVMGEKIVLLPNHGSYCYKIHTISFSIKFLPYNITNNEFNCSYGQIYILDFQNVNGILSSHSAIIIKCHPMYLTDIKICVKQAGEMEWHNGSCSKSEMEGTEIFNTSLHIFMGSVIEYLKEEYTYINPNNAYHIYECILYLYKTLPTSIIYSAVTKPLVTNNFLNTLIQMRSHFKESPQLQKIVISITLETLYALSIVELKIEQYWPGAEVEFRRELFEVQNGGSSIDYFSVDLDLAYVDNKNNCPTADILFSYFQFLVDNRFSDHFPNKCSVLEICGIITNIYNFGRLPIPIIKAIWLIFAISYLSMDKDCKKRHEIHAAQTILVNCLLNFDDLGVIYTHHPAILFWPFASSFVNRKIKLNVILLWLNNCNIKDRISYIQIKKLCSSCEDVTYCLIDMICTLKGDIYDSTLNTCCRLILDTMKNEPNKIDNLSFIAWSNLSNMLDSFLLNPDSLLDNNLICLLKISSHTMPIKHQSICSVLLEIVNKLLSVTSIISDSIEYTQKNVLMFYLLGSIILLISYFTNVSKNSKVVEILFGHRRFLTSITKILKICKKDENLQLCTATLQLCYTILNYQIIYKISYNGDVIKIDWDNVIFSISHFNEECMYLMIQLMHVVLSEYNDSLFITFQEPDSVFALRILYHRLLANIMKGEIKAVIFGFHGLSFVLSKCQLLMPSLYTDEVLGHLLLEPWICYLIRSTLGIMDSSELDSQPVCGFIMFLNVWISEYSRIKKLHNLDSGSRILPETYEVDTFRCIADKMLHICEKTSLTNKVGIKKVFSSIISKILRTDYLTETTRHQLGSYVVLEGRNI